MLLRLEPAAAYDPLAWVAWAAAWLAALIGLGHAGWPAGLPRPKAALILLAVAGAACWFLSPSLRCWHLVWMGYLAGAGHLVRRGWLHAAGLNGSLPGEVVRWFGLGLVSLGLLHPFLTISLLGGGDAQGYAMQMADFITQLRSGVFPVLVGQSVYAFNGDIHPLRTAPGLLYAGGLFDCLTLRALTPIALQNLLMVLAGLAGAFGTYLALIRFVPGRGWTAWILSVLFITSPGVLAPLFSGDMIATWTTLPWLPWLWLALIRMTEQPEDLAWPVRAVALLAALWWFHAPIGFWCSVCALPFVLCFLLGQRRGGHPLLVQTGLVGLFLLLAGYVFTSVITLAIPSDPNLRIAIEHGAIRASLDHSWKGFLRPVSQDASALLSDLQLSPALWFALLLGGLSLLRASARTPTRLLGGVALLLVLLLLPVSDHVWRHLPDLVLSTTEKWPGQRFFLILSALAVFVALPGFAALHLANRRLARDLTILLAAGCLWSLVESWKFVQRGRAITHCAQRSRQLLIPGNTPLSRYAHEYYGRLPRYFSHGPTDPLSRFRLLGADTLEPILTNSQSVLARTPPARVLVLTYEATSNGGCFTPTLNLPAGSRHLLHFDFHGLQPQGALQIVGRHMQREYWLPDSGEERAFGAGPGRDSTLTLWHADADEPDQVEIRFIGTIPPDEAQSVPTLRVIPMDGTDLPLELQSMVPLRMNIRSPAPAWLETPRLHVPGYRAVVNGQPVPAVASPDGVVMLPVPAGTAEVELTYPGPILLRPVFWFNLAGWVVLGLACFRRSVPRLRLPGFASPAFLSGLGRLVLGGTALALALALAHAGLGRLRPAPRSASADHPLHLTTPFAIGRPVGSTEKLADIDLGGRPMELIVVYTDGKRAGLGLQAPGGTPVFSEPFPVNYLLPQELEIRAAASPSTGWEVRANHRLVLVVPAAP